MPYQEHSIFHCTVSVKLRKQIQSATIDDQDIFLNINTVSLATVDCVLRRQVYRVPFESRCTGCLLSETPTVKQLLLERPETLANCACAEICSSAHLVIWSVRGKTPQETAR